ncbi:MAG: hypothetical protein Q8Q15_00715, partial [bacterium]|nr:hypothetical protein [bacterium]
MFQKIIKNHWPEILILAAIIFFLREVLFLGKIFIPQDIDLGDFVLGTIPETTYLAQALHQGRFPLWAPEFYAGFPFAVNGESGLYYPINLVLFYLFPQQIAWGLYALIAFCTLGFSLFYFLKNLNLSKEAALISTLSFTFATGIIVRIVHLPILGTIAFLPLTLLLAQLFFTKRNPLYLLALSFVLSLQILNFNPPTTLLCFLAFSLYFLFLTLTTFTKQKDFLANFASFAAVLILALSLSAVQLVPMAKMLSYSSRGGGVSEIEAKEFPFTPQELRYFFQATPFGDPSEGTYQSPSPNNFVFFWENNAYVGLTAFALGLLSLFLLWKKNKYVFFFGSLFIFSVILALGQFTPLFFLLRLPPFSFFRVPGRFLILSMFSLTILAGFAFDLITRKFPSKRTMTGVILASIIFIDLFSFGLFYNPTYDAKKWLSAPENAKFLQEDPSYFRTYILGEKEAFNALAPGWQKDIKPFFNLKEGLPGMTSLLYGLNQSEGFRLGLVPQRIVNWESNLQKNFQVDFEKGTAQTSPLAVKMIRLKNVKYVVTHYQINSLE